MVTGAKRLICSYSICLIFLIMLLSIAIPLGSTIKYSGSTLLAIVRTEVAKSPPVEQHMQPSVNSHILSSLLCRLSASILRGLTSFSRIATCLSVCFISSFIKVVLPAPRKPDMRSTFILVFYLNNRFYQVGRLISHDKQCLFHMLPALINMS